MKNAYRILLLIGFLNVTACGNETAEQTISAELSAFAASYTAAWNSGDPATVAALYAPDGVLTINGGAPSVGRESVQEAVAGFMAAFPDTVLSNDRLEAKNGRIDYHWTFTGTNTGPPFTGNGVAFSGYESWVFDDEGLVQDSIGTFDAVDYERQLYAQPAALTALGAEVFPADRGLARAEDGIALDDGSLLVTDQIYGLRKVLADGSSEPFGKMNQVGYRHAPPESHGGANGLSLEPDGTHVLVADIFGGGIYRIALADGQSSKIYQHRFGVNAAVRDSSGAIWFTQSAHNTGETAESGMWAAIDRPLGQGALLRLPVNDGQLAASPEIHLEGLEFANGLALDESAGALYVAETVAGRVKKYPIDVTAGTIRAGITVAKGIFPDNIVLDGKGGLWIASPLPNNVLILNTKSGESRWLLDKAPVRQELVDQWAQREAVGDSRMDLLTPDAWLPMPGFVTGVIFAEGRVFLSGLSNALVAIDLPDESPQ